MARGLWRLGHSKNSNWLSNPDPYSPARDGDWPAGPNDSAVNRNAS